MNTALRSLLLALALASLAACGGGGDHEDDSKTNPAPPACIERPDLCK